MREGLAGARVRYGRPAGLVVNCPLMMDKVGLLKTQAWHTEPRRRPGPGPDAASNTRSRGIAAMETGRGHAQRKKKCRRFLY